MLDDYTEHIVNAIYTAKEQKISMDIVGYLYEERFQVVIVKPRWMPQRLFRWLLKHIVVIKHTT